MANKQGFYYYTKEEIDEYHATEPFEFTLQRVGYGSETLTGNRIKLANGLYAYCYEGETTIPTTSTGLKEYNISWGFEFDTIIGASMNAAITGQSNSSLKFCAFRKSYIGFYVESVSTSGFLKFSFIVVGKVSEGQSDD